MKYYYVTYMFKGRFGKLITTNYSIHSNLIHLMEQNSCRIEDIDIILKYEIGKHDYNNLTNLIESGLRDQKINEILK